MTEFNATERFHNAKQLKVDLNQHNDKSKESDAEFEKLRRTSRQDLFINNGVDASSINTMPMTAKRERCLSMDNVSLF